MTTTQAQSPSLPPSTRNDIYSVLLSGTGIRAIEQVLDHEMSTSGWKANLRAYITHLFRSGQCSTFDEALDRVKDKIRQDNVEGGTAKQEEKVNGVNGTNGATTTNGNGHAKGADDEYDLRIPEKVTVQGSKTVLAELEKVCEITAAD